MFEIPFIQVPFGYVLEFLYNFTKNYGISLILFALLIKLILLYPSAKGKKSMMKMTRLTPQVQALQEKYKDDQQKANLAVQQLYKDEHVSMFGGCLWSLLPMVLLIPLYHVIREPLQYLMHLSASQASAIVDWLKNTAGVALTSNTYYQELAAAPMVSQYANELAGALEGVQASSLLPMNFNFLGIDLGQVPSWQFWTWAKVDWSNIGLVLLPILSAGSNVLSMLISQKMNNTVVTDKNGLEDKETAKKAQSNGTNKVMMIVMPLMTLWIGFTVPGALSLYWMASGVYAIIQDVILTKHYRKVYDAEDAERQKRFAEKLAEQERLEAKRAERRAANPDGITENTSKKKLAQQQRAESQAAAKAYADKKAGGKSASESRDDTLSGVPERPYCKGRNYDPNRYASRKSEE